jgi:hypothetical protein
MCCQKLNWIELVHIRLQWELSVGYALDGCVLDSRLSQRLFSLPTLSD